MSERIYYSQEGRMRAMRRITLLIVLAASIGIGIGYVFGLLFAPEEGEAARESLAQSVEKRIGATERQVNELRSKLEDRIAR